MSTICILGRQPALGLAELESLYGAKAVQPVGQHAALIETDPLEVPIGRLGGSLKVCKLLSYINSTEWPVIIKYLSDTLPQHVAHIPSGKIHLGLSLYGFSLNASKINAGALSLKKNLRSASRGVRIIPNKQPDLNTAQVIHNNLIGKNGIELILIRWGNRTVLAQTVGVQDIEAYAARDQKRPMRDTRVGMLPPKLAQIIINLAGSHTLSSTGLRPTTEESSKASVIAAHSRLLDPFCGTGVLLQESLLMGYDAYGTDLEPRMIEYSEVNLEWLVGKQNVSGTYALGVADATTYTWEKPLHLLAGETYLGRPFSALPKPEILDEVVQDVNTIHKKFLQNVARQTEPGFRMCIAIPAWSLPQNTSFRHLPVLDSLEEMGYNRVSFVHAGVQDLVYHRPDQIVGRELVVLIRK